MPNCWVSVVVPALVYWSKKRSVKSRPCLPMFNRYLCSPLVVSQPSPSCGWGIQLPVSATLHLDLSVTSSRDSIDGDCKMNAFLFRLNDLFIYCFYIYLLPVSKKRLYLCPSHLLPSVACTLCWPRTEIFPPSKCTCWLELNPHRQTAMLPVQCHNIS